MRYTAELEYRVYEKHERADGLTFLDGGRSS